MSYKKGTATQHPPLLHFLQTCDPFFDRGWVSNKCAHVLPLNGSAIYIEALLASAACIGSLFEILAKALIKPNGFRVNSTAEASPNILDYAKAPLEPLKLPNGPKTMANTKAKTSIMTLKDPITAFTIIAASSSTQKVNVFTEISQY